MKKINFIIFSLILLISGCYRINVDFSTLEERAGIFYVKGEDHPFTGESIDYYENKIVKGIFNIKNGLFHGKYSLTYKDRSLKLKGKYYNGLEEGKWTYYFEDGSVNYISEYKKGKEVYFKSFKEIQGNLIVQRNGLFYVKADNTLFTGKVISMQEPNNIYSTFFVREGLYHGKNQSFRHQNLISSCNYYNGKLNGESIFYFLDGQIKKTGVYSDNKKVGEWITYLQNGKINYKILFDNSGNETVFHPLESLISTQNKLNDRPNNKKKNYKFSGNKTIKDDKDNIIRKEIYKEGQKHGKFYYYYADGKLQGEEVFFEGKRSGESKFYFKNGNISYKCNYIDGFKHGNCIRYFENGNIQYKTFYNNNIILGDAMEYYENGNLKRKISYKDSMNDFNAICYYNNGQKKSIQYYVSDLKDNSGKVRNGYWEFFDERGIKREEYNFKTGKICEDYILYDYNGNILKEKLKDEIISDSYDYYDLESTENYNTLSDYDYELEIQKIFYESGNIRSEIPWKGNIIHGEKKDYYDNGNILHYARYNMGKIFGPEKFYYPNGKISRKIIFNQNGKKDMYYYENGRIKTIENYKIIEKDKNDFSSKNEYILHGKYLEFDENTNIYEEKEYTDGKS